MTYEVFFSHNSEDFSWADKIKNEAEKEGIKVYLYEDDPQPGKYVAEKVKETIRRCDSVIFFLTKNSQKSAYVQQEIGFAQALNKLIIPIVDKGANPNSLAMLTGIEYFPFDQSNINITNEKLIPFLLEHKNKVDNPQLSLLQLGAIGFLLYLMFKGE